MAETSSILKSPASKNSASSVPFEAEYVLTEGDTSRSGFAYRVYTAFSEFLAIPTAIVLGLVLVGLAIYAIEQADPVWTQPLREAITRHILKDSQATGNLLDMMGGGVLTMTSIIVSMLLLVLQQSAGNMGNMVYDQFLQRRSNQIYAGLVVGTVVLVLLMSSTVSDSYNPVLGATFALGMVILIVIMLLLFLYFTIEQMRPEWIIRAIHKRTLTARSNYRALVDQMRDDPVMSDGYRVDVRIQRNGYLVSLDLARLEAAVEAAGAPVEINILRSIGGYIHFFDCIAEVRAADRETARTLAEATGAAFRLATAREMAIDPAFGLEQLEMMAWTEISSAKHNPETGLQVVYSLRDILSRWIDEEPVTVDKVLPIVYQDHFPPDVMNVLESLVAVSADGVQHQNMTEIIKTLDVLYDRFPAELQARSEELVRRSIPALDSFLLTHNLESALKSMIARLDASERTETARVLEDALGKMSGRMPATPRPDDAL